jgi:methyl-accepting chemotaxis protein
MFLKKKEERPWRRRNYFIKKGFQARFILKFLGIVIFGSAISGCFIYLLTTRNIENTFYSSHIKISSTGQLVLPTLLRVNSGVIVLVLLAVAVLTLFISNKVAGPVYRMGKSTEKIGQQDFTANFTLRSGDETKYLAESFDDMNRGLKGRFDRLRRQAREVDMATDNLLQCCSARSESPSVGMEPEKRMTAELAGGVETLKSELSKLKT